jgi:hypothetical protein
LEEIRGDKIRVPKQVREVEHEDCHLNPFACLISFSHIRSHLSHLSFFVDLISQNSSCVINDEKKFLAKRKKTRAIMHSIKSMFFHHSMNYSI